MNANSRSPARRLPELDTIRSFSASEPRVASTSPSAPAATPTAPCQKVSPTTAACWIRVRSGGVRESRRAASTAWTVSGRASPAPPPSSRIRLTISSANSGLPPERSATWATTRGSHSSLSAGSSAATNSWARSGPSGSRAIVVALRRPPPQPGRRSSSSSRARQTSSTGPRTQRARYSIRSSMPSSAQWMSSTASTSGWIRLAASTSERTALNRRARVCCGSSPSRMTPSTTSSGTSTPRGRAIVAATRSGGSSLSDPPSSNSFSKPKRSFDQAAPESSVSTIWNCSRTISPSAQ